MKKTDRSVVRNQAYRRGEFSIRERHNERDNETYYNSDILLDRSHLNVHFKACEGTYEQEFNRMLEEGTISLRGLKADAKVFDELVFDVNSEYFDRNGAGNPCGSYEYARDFFAEAYKLAIKEAGGEEYILSAVMHADERNKAMSEQLNRDVFHYHLHVVYVPVVDKEIYFKKNNKNPELAGKLRKVIKQASHSKKWPRFRDDDGHWVNSYSLLQDRFHEHMKVAGYTDIERGKRGSTAEHLDTLDYKIKQDEARASALDAAINEKSERSAALDTTVKKKQERISALDDKITVKKQTSAAFADIDAIPKKTLGGNYQLTPADWKTVSSLAKEGIKSRDTIKILKQSNNALQSEVAQQKSQLKEYGEGMSITDTMHYHQAQQRAPRRMDEVIADIMRQPPEQQPNRAQTRGKRHTHER